MHRHAGIGPLLPDLTGADLVHEDFVEVFLDTFEYRLLAANRWLRLRLHLPSNACEWSLREISETSKLGRSSEVTAYSEMRALPAICKRLNDLFPLAEQCSSPLEICYTKLACSGLVVCKTLIAGGLTARSFPALMVRSTNTVARPSSSRATRQIGTLQPRPKSMRRKTPTRARSSSPWLWLIPSQKSATLPL